MNLSVYDVEGILWAAHSADEKSPEEFDKECREKFPEYDDPLLDFRIEQYNRRKSPLEEGTDALEKIIERADQRARRGYCDTDLYSIRDWFLSIIPDMLLEYKDSRNSSPCIGEDGEHITTGESHDYDFYSKNWDKILDRMIFLFREANEDTCSKKNPYDEEYNKAYDEFIEKYGVDGEKLRTEEENEYYNRTGNITMHFLGDAPEYKDIHDKHMAAWSEIEEYREKCRVEAMELFTKYMNDLWS